MGTVNNVSGINSAGQVVGEDGFQTTKVQPDGSVIGGVNAAYVTGPNGQGVTLLEPLYFGKTSQSMGINDQGVVVGYSTVQGNLNLVAFIDGLNGSGVVDLNNLVTLADGATLEEAVAVNNRNQIVAIASDGQTYLLTPVPEPRSSALFALGLVPLIALARRQRQAASGR